MPGVMVRGTPYSKGSMTCVGPRCCPSCGAKVFHQLIEDDKTGGGKDWRAKLEQAAAGLRRRTGTFEQAVSVDAWFIFERPAAARGRLWPHVRPDADKLGRMGLDALQSAHLLANDALVVDLSLHKRYAPFTYKDNTLTSAGAFVQVDPMVDPDALPIRIEGEL